MKSLLHRRPNVAPLVALLLVAPIPAGGAAGDARAAPDEAIEATPADRLAAATRELAKQARGLGATSLEAALRKAASTLRSRLHAADADLTKALDAARTRAESAIAADALVRRPLPRGTSLGAAVRARSKAALQAATTAALGAGRKVRAVAIALLDGMRKALAVPRAAAKGRAARLADRALWAVRREAARLMGRAVREGTALVRELANAAKDASSEALGGPPKPGTGLAKATQALESKARALPGPTRKAALVVVSRLVAVATRARASTDALLARARRDLAGAETRAKKQLTGLRALLKQPRKAPWQIARKAQEATRLVSRAAVSAAASAGAQSKKALAVAQKAWDGATRELREIGEPAQSLLGAAASLFAALRREAAFALRAVKARGRGAIAAVMSAARAAADRLSGEEVATTAPAKRVRMSERSAALERAAASAAVSVRDAARALARALEQQRRILKGGVVALVGRIVAEPPSAVVAARAKKILAAARRTPAKSAQTLARETKVYAEAARNDALKLLAVVRSRAKALASATRAAFATQGARLRKAKKAGVAVLEKAEGFAAALRERAARALLLGEQNVKVAILRAAARLREALTGPAHAAPPTNVRRDAEVLATLVASLPGDEKRAGENANAAKAAREASEAVKQGASALVQDAHAAAARESAVVAQKVLSPATVEAALKAPEKAGAVLKDAAARFAMQLEAKATAAVARAAAKAKQMVAAAEKKLAGTSAVFERAGAQAAGARAALQALVASVRREGARAVIAAQEASRAAVRAEVHAVTARLQRLRSVGRGRGSSIARLKMGLRKILADAPAATRVKIEALRASGLVLAKTAQTKVGEVFRAATQGATRVRTEVARSLSGAAVLAALGKGGPGAAQELAQRAKKALATALADGRKIIAVGRTSADAVIGAAKEYLVKAKAQLATGQNEPASAAVERAEALASAARIDAGRLLLTARKKAAGVVRVAVRRAKAAMRGANKIFDDAGRQLDLEAAAAEAELGKLLPDADVQKLAGEEALREGPIADALRKTLVEASPVDVKRLAIEDAAQLKDDAVDGVQKVLEGKLDEADRKQKPPAAVREIAGAQTARVLAEGPIETPAAAVSLSPQDAVALASKAPARLEEVLAAAAAKSAHDAAAAAAKSVAGVPVAEVNDVAGKAAAPAVFAKGALAAAPPPATEISAESAATHAAKDPKGFARAAGAGLEKAAEEGASRAEAKLEAAAPHADVVKLAGGAQEAANVRVPAAASSVALDAVDAKGASRESAAKSETAVDRSLADSEKQLTAADVKAVQALAGRSGDAKALADEVESAARGQSSPGASPPSVTNADTAAEATPVSQAPTPPRGGIETEPEAEPEALARAQKSGADIPADTALLDSVWSPKAAAFVAGLVQFAAVKPSDPAAGPASLVGMPAEDPAPEPKKEEPPKRPADLPEDAALVDAAWSQAAESAAARAATDAQALVAARASASAGGADATSGVAIEEVKEASPEPIADGKRASDPAEDVALLDGVWKPDTTLLVGALAAYAQSAAPASLSAAAGPSIPAESAEPEPVDAKAGRPQDLKEDVALVDAGWSSALAIASKQSADGLPTRGAALFSLPTSTEPNKYALSTDKRTAADVLAVGKQEDLADAPKPTTRDEIALMAGVSEGAAVAHLKDAPAPKAIFAEVPKADTPRPALEKGDAPSRVVERLRAEKVTLVEPAKGLTAEEQALLAGTR